MSHSVERLVLFGATGDLAGRYLLPALANLVEVDALPEGFELVGAARSDLDDESYRRWAAEQLKEHADGISEDARSRLLASIRYHRIDLEQPPTIAAAIGDDPRPIAAYLALPPTTFATAVESLVEAGLPQGSQIVFEKPFGEDLSSAQALNELLERLLDDEREQAVFRVDHVLGMATVNNLIGARFYNHVLEALWNSTHIAEVDILWDETLALEGRAGYFDSAGMLKDVIQNHVMQVLCLVAMEPPTSEHSLQKRKVELLRSVRIPSVETAAKTSTRGRYTAGTLAPPPEGAGTDVPNYADEEGVDPARGTETFAELALELDSPRWAGTRFLLRGGKALDRRRKMVVVRFRDNPRDGVNGETQPPPNELHFGLDGPTNIALRLSGAILGPPQQLVPLILDAEPPADQLPAYSQVLQHVLNDDHTLSVSGEEAELAWRIVTPFLQAWADDQVPLQEYQAGGRGPANTVKAAGLNAAR